MRDQAESSAVLERIFAHAVQLPAGEVDSYLDQACGGDRRLRAELAELLAADERAGGFIEEAVAAGAAALELAADGGAAGRLIGRYRLIREVGRGGMGAVYLAERCDRQFRHRVAVKLLRRGMDSDDILRRFRAERQILASLQHPHIAELFDGGTSDDGRPYFVMEYVEGLPIDLYCDRHRLSVEQRLELFEAVCGAVRHAHQNLVVHRDLKPSNVLVTPDGVPKLLDFGIAKLLDADPAAGAGEPTGRTQRLLTPNYASPEQIRGGAVTTASDVYSLGVVLYELLTGRRPYRLGSHGLAEIERTVCEQEPERPSAVVAEGARATERAARRAAGSGEKLRRRLRGDLDNIALMALRKEPERRYRSVEQLVEDLCRHRRGHPVIARRDTFAYRTGKLLRRHRWAAAAAAALLALVVAFAVAMALQSARTARERDRAAQVSELLVELFEIADPGELRGNTVTAREILDRGAEKVRGMQERPETAHLMATLARLYEELGLYGRAAPLHQHALEIRRRTLGPRHPEVAESLNALARVVALGGDYERAEPLFRQGLSLRRELFGREHPEVAASLNNLALVLHDLGRYREAEPLYRQTLEMDRKLLGAQHPQTSRTLSNVALLLLDMGDYGEAERLYREALEIRRREYGEEHPDYAETLEELAVTRHARGDAEGAEPLLRQALAVRQAALGEEHLATARSLYNLGRVLLGRGFPAAAEPLLDRAQVLRRQLLGAQHPEVAASYEGLAELALERGKTAEAEALYRRALTIYETVFSAEHPQAAQVLLELGELLAGRGECRRAEPLLRRAVASRRRALPAGSWLIAEAEGALGGCLAQRGQTAEARPLLERSAAVLTAALGPEHPRTVRARVRRQAAP